MVPQHDAAAAPRIRFGRRQVTPHVCIVDRKPHLRAFLAETMVDFGLVPRQAADAAGVIAANDDVPADLVIYSLTAGAGEAEDFLRKLAAVKYAGKVLLIGPQRSDALISAYALGGRLGLGMVPALGAPFRVEELADRIRALGNITLNLEAPVDVAEALAHDWMEVWYQPKIDAQTMMVWGAEALCRLRHPVWGIVLPASFIPAYDDPHLRHLSDFVVGQVEKDGIYFSDWRAVEIGINVPAILLRDREFCEALRGTAARLGPGSVMLEVSSTDVIRDVAFARKAAAELRHHGIGFSIDGVGPEWPLLTGLSDFPFAEIKVSHAFIEGCASDGPKRGACRAIVEFAKGAGARTVAQGVETRADLHAVRELGFNLVQGFVFAKPMEARKFARSLVKRSPRRAAAARAGGAARADGPVASVTSPQSEVNLETMAQISAGA